MPACHVACSVTGVGSPRKRRARLTKVVTIPPREDAKKRVMRQNGRTSSRKPWRKSWLNKPITR